MNIVLQQSISIPDIVSDLKSGKAIVYPTETCYGLGCDATNQLAVDKIFSIKKRQNEKSVLVVAPSISMIIEYIDWTPALQKIADNYWPGALTVVTKAKNNCTLAKGVIANDGTVAFRISSHPFVTTLSEALEKPLVSTSANITSQESPYDIESVLKMFENSSPQPDIIIDAGILPHKNPSTIIRLDNDKITVLRQGEIIIQ